MNNNTPFDIVALFEESYEQNIYSLPAAIDFCTSWILIDSVSFETARNCIKSGVEPLFFVSENIHADGTRAITLEVYTDSKHLVEFYPCTDSMFSRLVVERLIEKSENQLHDLRENMRGRFNNEYDDFEINFLVDEQ